MKIAVLYVGSSLPAALRRAERDIRQEHGLALELALHNCTLPLSDSEFRLVERDFSESQIIFIIHITDAENSARIAAAVDKLSPAGRAVIVMSCLPELMRRTRLKKLAFSGLFSGERAKGPRAANTIARRLGGWVSRYAASRRRTDDPRRPEDYLKLLTRAPALLRFVPSAGALGDVKHYVALYCYFLQPTPANVRGLLLYAIKHCVDDSPAKRIRIAPPENKPATGIYHPDAPELFATFESYREWYERRSARSGSWRLDPRQTIGLLLMRPQVISGAHRHYRELIGALESEGLPVLPVLSTFMDNRQACESFLVDRVSGAPRVSQLLSLTGFSFVGGPAMNDSAAAIAYLERFNRPLHSAITLEMQRSGQWAESRIGLNPVQTAMQVAIPEIDGASEPVVYAGTAADQTEPEAFADRCARIARRAARWNRLRAAARRDLKLAFLIYCFPPNKGNLGTAADLDVFPSLWEMLRRLATEGYDLEVPANPDSLRESLLGGGDELTGADSSHLARVAYRMPADEYFRLNPHVEEIEAEWGPAPGRINSEGRDILIHGAVFNKAFIGVQPTFGYEGDPMKLLMAEGGTPHHGFAALYLYLDHIFHADAVVHVGTHGALEFMPGKQAGLSSNCWPDRLIGDFPNVYVYSVNNPSEGSIAKRRSYAELISYLTPPIESAGLYKELAALKELIAAYRTAEDDGRKERLFDAIEEKGRHLNLSGA
jgi:magnesium chelatase subunit H